MLLSLVIKHTTQILFPALQLCGLIKPVLTEHRENIKLHNRTHPLISAASLLPATEIAMADLEAATEGLVLCDFFIQILDLVNQGIKGLVCKCFLIVSKTFGIEARFHLEEAKPSAEGIIDHRKAPVGCVHHTYDIQIFRDRERHTTVGKSGLCSSVVLYSCCHG